MRGGLNGSGMSKSGGRERTGEVTDREWRRLDPLPLHAKKSTQGRKTKYQKMTGNGDSHGEGDRQRHKVDGGTNIRQPPRYQQAPRNRPRAVRGGERTQRTA